MKTPKQLELPLPPVEQAPTKFIEPQNFQRLRTLQQELSQATEISFSLRKLVNLLMTEDNLQHLKTHLIEQLRNINYP